MKDRSKFSKFMAVVSEMFEKTPSKTIINVYWQALEPYTDEQCEKAFNEVVLSSRFFPKPVDIIETIRGTGVNRATLAWVKTLEAIKHTGTYKSVKFDDPVIHSVIELMNGWPAMGDMHVDDEKWKQKEFERLYLVMEARGNHPAYLPGRVEIENTKTGHLEHIKGPVLIGEFPEKPVLKITENAA